VTPVPRVSTRHASVRASLTARIARAGAWAAVAVVGVALALAWVFAGADGWGPRSSAPLLLDALVLVGLAITWVAVRTESERRVGERDVSGAIERSSGLGSGEVQGALELERALPAGVSGPLARRHASQVAGRLSGNVRDLSGELGMRLRGWERRAGLVAAAVGVLVVGLVVATPSRSFAAWTGLLRPVSLWTGPTLPALVVEPGDADVPRGEDVELSVAAPLREAVTLRWQEAGDIEREADLAVDPEGRARHVFASVTAEIRYSIVAPDGAQVGPWTLRPVDPLFVADVRVRLEYPTYLDRGVEELRGDVDRILVPEGTRIAVAGQGSRDISAARLVDGAERTIELDVEGAGFEGGFRPTRAGTWTWVFLDQAGDSAALVPQPLAVDVVPDSAPSVSILAPSPDTVLPLDLRQPLTIRARDDHGLRTLELMAWRVNALGEAQEPRRQTLDLGGVGAVLVPPVLDVSSWELVAGDQVHYRVEVRDIHPQARVARSDTRILRMPTAEELRRDATSRMAEAGQRLEELRERAEASAEATRDLARQEAAPDRTAEGRRAEPGENQAGDFGASEDARSAVAEQQELVDEAARMADELAALEAALREAGAADPQLAADLREMQELLDQLGGEEASSRLQEMMDRLEDAGDAARRSALDDLGADQDGFRERLEEAMERLERAATEQDLRNVASESERLAEQERALAEALAEGGDAQELAARQEDLLTDAAEAAERLDDLAQRMAERGDFDAAQQLEQASQAGDAASRSMQSAQQMAQQGQQQAAGQQAQAAAEQLDEQAQALRDAQQERMQEQAEAYRRALVQTSEDALALAREQERVQDQAESAGSPAERQRVRAEMSTVYEGAENLTQRMEIAQRVAGQNDHTLTSRLGIALERLDEALQAVEAGERPRAGAAEADRAIDALNQVALASLAAQRALDQAGSSSAESSDPMEQLEQLAQQQADVNNRAAEMMPMPMPQQSRQQQMQQMAQQQQQIAADLGQMSNQEGDQGPLADLQSLGEEAEAIARELEQGRLEPETRERQERLFHRLLDAGRSLEKEEESTERESDEVTGFETGEIPGLSADALGLARFGLPDAAALNRLPPAMRALVRNYFERLNRDAGGLPGDLPATPPAGGGGR
jgi:hypothetical protein